jgi:Lon protease-like protein
MISEVTALPLFPLDTVLFPGMPLPLHIFEERYRLMVNQCLDNDRGFGVVMSTASARDTQTSAEHLTGTTAQITKVQRLQNGRMNIMTQGGERFRLLQLVQSKPYFVASVEHVPLEGTHSPDAPQLARRTSALFMQYMRLQREVVGTMVKIEATPKKLADLAYLVATTVQVSLKDKQHLLELGTLPQLFTRELQILAREVEVLKRMRKVQESGVGFIEGATGRFSLS